MVFPFSKCYRGRWSACFCEPPVSPGVIHVFTPFGVRLRENSILWSGHCAASLCQFSHFPISQFSHSFLPSALRLRSGTTSLRDRHFSWRPLFSFSRFHRFILLSSATLRNRSHILIFSQSPSPPVLPSFRPSVLLPTASPPQSHSMYKKDCYFSVYDILPDSPSG